MRTVTVGLTRMLCFSAMLAFAPGGASAQAPAARDIPQSIGLQHEESIRSLGELAKAGGGVGRVAARALDILKRHHAREMEYILPPLTLLPAIARGQVTKEMAWAVAMADKLKAAREEVFLEHAAITEVMNELLFEANREHNDAAAEFALDAVADSLNDLEIQEPASIMVGDVIRARLAAQ